MGDATFEEILACQQQNGAAAVAGSGRNEDRPLTNANVVPVSQLNFKALHLRTLSLCSKHGEPENPHNQADRPAIALQVLYNKTAKAKGKAKSTLRVSI